MNNSFNLNEIIKKASLPNEKNTSKLTPSPFMKRLLEKIKQAKENSKEQQQ